MQDNKFLIALKGKKVPRKKIRVDNNTMENLKAVKKQINSTLDICEMAECCFDFFDYKDFISGNTDLFDTLQIKKESAQLLIREDIYNELQRMKNKTAVPVQSIVSCIIDLQLKKIN